MSKTVESDKEKYNITCVYIYKDENKVAIVDKTASKLPDLKWKKASSMKKKIQSIVKLLSSMIYTVSEEDVNEIIGYYNEKFGKNLKPETYRSLIEARYSEGYKADDFKTVIDNKASEWLNNPKMASNLKPTTLFRACHFDEYLNTVKYIDPNKLQREPTFDISEYEKYMKSGKALDDLNVVPDKEAEDV